MIWSEPPPETPPGHVVEPRDYPGMQRSLERLDTTFFPDARETVTGEALERVLAEGVRSVLRVPIVVAGAPSCCSRSAGRASSTPRRPDARARRAASPITLGS